MNKYQIFYDFKFFDLNFDIYSHWLNGIKIADFKNIIDDYEVKFTFYAPQPINEQDLKKVITPSKSRKKGNTVTFYLIGQEKISKDDIKLICLERWRQFIEIEFYSGKDLAIETEYSFLNSINNVLINYLNNLLSIYRDNFERYRWNLPVFKSAVDAILNSNSRCEVEITRQFLKNNQGSFATTLEKTGEITINQFDHHKFNKIMEDVISNFENIGYKENYAIDNSKELILLADYEKDLHRPKIAVLLSAINVENKVVKIRETYNIKLTEQDKINKNGKENKVIAICRALLRLYPELSEYINLKNLYILFNCRNKIAHEDEMYYNDDSENKIYLTNTEANQLIIDIKDFISNKIPCIENIIETKLKQNAFSEKS